jgi:hypothetical protein
MKLEDFVKAAIKFYEHNTHKRATYTKPDPKKNKFEIKCGRILFDVFYHDKKLEAYIQYQDFDDALTYHCESPKNMANAMIRFPMIIQELKQIRKALLAKGKTFFASLPKKRGRRFGSDTIGFSIYDGEAIAGNMSVDRPHDKNFNTLSTNASITWHVYEPIELDDREDTDETDLDQAFDNFVTEYSRLYLPVEN